MNQTSAPLSHRQQTEENIRHNHRTSFFKRFFSLFCIICLCWILGNQAVFAQWSSNPAVNNAISTATNSQYAPAIISDGVGGAIITWHDNRSGSNNNNDIYAQRINASGAVQWTADGIAICTATNNQFSPTIVSDGAGGAIITWSDNRSGSNNNFDIYAQRINATGTVQWTADGVAICTEPNYQYNPTIASDESGGAIISWYDNRNGIGDDIYAQRINASGAVQWTVDGVAICTATNSQTNPIIVSDGSGGAIITWNDGRTNASDIYAQRINALGAVQWTADGVAISTATNSQYTPTVVSDESGGAIITWLDFRNGSNWDIYAQRINASGLVQWTADGVAICTATIHLNAPTIVSDGAGGAIITWFDGRNGSNGGNGTNFDIYVQRINASGAVQWTANGIAICTAPNEQYGQEIVSDGSGGAIITWYDYRSGSNFDIYAQRVNATGAVQWTADGTAISTAISEQFEPNIVSDGSGGAIITWHDVRNGSDFDIYAQNVNADGTIGIDCAADTYNIFTATNVSSDLGNDKGKAIEVGVKFRVTQPGYVTGVRFYKKKGNVGTHIGHLWSATGTKLGEATFINETTSGWQEVLFSTPVPITPGITYVASYFSSLGYYNVTRPSFTSAVVNGPVRALANGEDGSNGVSKYSTTPILPTTGYQGSNYWADVIFTTCVTADVTQQSFRQLTSEETSSQKLVVKITPNPGIGFFKLIVMSDNKIPVGVRISDIAGRILEHHEKVPIGNVIQIGQSLKDGAYFAEVIQGNQRKVVKIIKVN